MTTYERTERRERERRVQHYVDQARIAMLERQLEQLLAIVKTMIETIKALP